MTKITIYTSSATSDLTVKKNQQSARDLLDKKKVQYEEKDLATIEKAERDKVYADAATKKIPLIFVNGKYLGDYETIQDMEEDQQLDKALK